MHKLQPGQRPVTVWLTGLSGSGKSTLAYALEQKLIALKQAATVLDGDHIRLGLSRDLGFSAEDRRENIRRVAEVARLMNDAGLVVIASFISPFKEDRAMARQVIDKDAFLEIYLSAPLSVCEQRDPKGLYAKARAGHIKYFTGVSAPYEEPVAPDLTLNTGQLSLDACVDLVIKMIVLAFALPQKANASSAHLEVIKS